MVSARLQDAASARPLNGGSVYLPTRTRLNVGGLLHLLVFEQDRSHTDWPTYPDMVTLGSAPNNRSCATLAWTLPLPATGLEAPGTSPAGMRVAPDLRRMNDLNNTEVHVTGDKSS